MNLNLKSLKVNNMSASERTGMILAIISASLIMALISWPLWADNPHHATFTDEATITNVTELTEITEVVNSTNVINSY